MEITKGSQLSISRGNVRLAPSLNPRSLVSFQTVSHGDIYRVRATTKVSDGSVWTIGQFLKFGGIENNPDSRGRLYIMSEESLLQRHEEYIQEETRRSIYAEVCKDLLGQLAQEKAESLKEQHEQALAEFKRP